MKKLLFGLLFTFGICNFTFAQDNLFDDLAEESTDEIIQIVEEKPKAVWQTSFEEAVTKAKAEQKPILIYFTGSDWCGPCKRIEEDVFSTEKFINLSDENLVLYKADFPRNADLVTAENKSMNQQLSSRYNQTSFPTMLIVNEYGATLGRKNGMYMSDSYFYFFEDIVRRYKI